MEKAKIPHGPEDRRIPITVLHIEPMSKGRVRVKIKENNANLIDMHHQGKEYAVVKNLGRGRYIMRPAPVYNTEMIMEPKRKFQGGLMPIDRHPRP